ncbi:hypothetical protein WAK64_19705 [Bacillus spongiae]|uniref:DUF4203 domain-containing protein n=1 Tax=Bacillus spongiae TaxID=2683610 RepID=A0ABU8HIR8_9BACI
MEFASEFFIALLFILLLVGIFAAVPLVLSFKKENRICCLGGGTALGIVSFSLGLLITSVITFETSSLEFIEAFTIIVLVILLIIAVFVSLFTLVSVIKKKEFCCLGGGIALAGIGYGASIILTFSFVSKATQEIFLTVFVLSIIILLAVSITAFLVILISLKKCKGLCCFAGVIALAGVALGIGTFFTGVNVGSVIPNILLLFILMGVLILVVDKEGKKNC